MHEATTDERPATLQRILTRRALLRGAAGLAAGVPLAGLLAACGGDDDDDAAATVTPGTQAATTTGVAASASTATVATGSTTSAGEWSFTDDRGVTITLPTRPERVVAYVPIAAALWDVGVRPVGIYGTTLRADGGREITVGEIDLDAVESLGEVYGELDLEKLVALQPELIVFDMYTDEVDLWGLDAGASAQVEALAPIVGISFVEKPVTEVIARIEELAQALGADLAAPEVTQARAAFEEASAELEAAVADKPDLTTIFIAGWPENLYIANPELWADLIYFHELGLDIVMPDALDEGYPIWQTLSWEQANKYPADLALQDARAGAPTIEELNEFPTWAEHPASKVDQVGPWQTEFVPSHRGFTGVLTDLAAEVREARDDVV